jgi:hypothetical protein
MTVRQTPIAASFSRFAKDEGGLLLAETLVLLPLLIWAFLALFVYWDVFRVINATQKAAYSIADVISRQGVIDDNYIDGLQKVTDFLVPYSPSARLRITSIQYDGVNNKYIKLWSDSPGNKLPELTLSQITALKSRIPTMAHKDSVFIVEAEVDYTPNFNTGVMGVGTGVTSHTVSQFVVTRPRVYRRICKVTPVCPPDL